MTIKDIARLSGCSVSTISRVINDRPDVRPETKEKVLQMMRESGFVPNTNARQLKIQQSRSLVFVVKGTRNLFFSDFLVQLQRAATLYGYSGIVSYLDENANEIDAAQKILREIKPKGMIFLGGSVANFQQGFANITVPSVLTTLVSDELDFPNLSMVGVDDRAAARTAVSHLIAQGHRKIAVLGGPTTSYPSRMRRLGAQDAMEDAGHARVEYLIDDNATPHEALAHMCRDTIKYGLARCMEGDRWNPLLGKYLALKRAKGTAIPARILAAIGHISY